MKRVVMLALGSRGDVQPFLALARTLQARGVQCVVVALQDYADLVERAGVGFVPVRAWLADEMGPQMSGPAGAIALRSSLLQYIVLRRWLARIAVPVADAVAHAVGPGDTVLAGILARDCATAAAEHHGGPSATVLLTGLVPTSDGASLFQSPVPERTSPINRVASGLMWQMTTAVSRAPGNVLRRRWGLREIGAAAATAQGDAHPTIVAVEPLLLPTPADQPPRVHQTGSLITPPAPPWGPPAELAAFLAEAPRPVYVGFGSPGAGYRPVGVGLLDEVARLASCRIISPAPLGSVPGRATGRVLLADDVPHEWLIPRTAAMAHHGGAGTTVAGLRAGVPSVAVPFGVDQPYQARRLHELGVGPPPLPRRRLTAARLAARIMAMTTGPRAAAYRVRAADVGAAMRAVDGPGLTADVLERLGLVPERPAETAEAPR